jgi:allantoinase
LKKVLFTEQMPGSSLNKTKKIFSKRCWLNGKLQPATVCFENGVITEIHLSGLEDAEDVGDDILMPGVIDAHVHINEPGRTDWEGFDTATRAAAAGGTTTLVDMPLNSSPVTTTVSAFTKKQEAARDKLNVNAGFYGGLIPGNQGEIEGLIKAGVLGIKCFLTHSGIDEFPKVTEKDLEIAMPIIARYNIPLLVHCELESECVHELSANPTLYRQYLLSRPKKWEDDAVAMMIGLCRKYRCRVHIVHVSSAGALGLIEKAKEEGLPLTAETCPHYIYFCAEEIPDGHCLFKCAPPIRERENNAKLKEALAKGVLDFIASDHSPAPPSIKEMESGNLQKAWGGIAGLQYLLSSSWTALKEMMPLEKFIPLLTENPAGFIGVSDKKGRIGIGYDADLVVWDPQDEMKVLPKDILFRHKISPYIGEVLSGTVKQTLVNGITVFQNDTVTNKIAGRCLYHL